MELAPNVKWRGEDNNGDPLSGGLLYTYEAGTSTLKTTYSDRSGTTNTNPVVLNSRGECDLWLDTGYYKFVLKDSAENTIWTKDNIAIASTESLSSAFFRGVISLTSANSPYTVPSTANGKLIDLDTSSGAITINMPEQSGLILPFNVAFKLRTGSSTVTINRAGTDTFEGSTTATLSAVGQSKQFVANTDTSPDRWSVLDLGVTTSAPQRRSVSANTSVTNTDDEIIVTAACTITLLAANSTGAKPVRIINAISGGGTVTVTRSGSDTIWDETSQYLYNQHDSLVFVPDGTSKYYIGS